MSKKLFHFVCIIMPNAATNKNLTALFTTTWRWPMSDAAKIKAGAYP